MVAGHSGGVQTDLRAPAHECALPLERSGWHWAGLVLNPSGGRACPGGAGKGHVNFTAVPVVLRCHHKGCMFCGTQMSIQKLSPLAARNQERFPSAPAHLQPAALATPTPAVGAARDPIWGEHPACPADGRRKVQRHEEAVLAKALGAPGPAKGGQRGGFARRRLENKGCWDGGAAAP